MLIAAPIPGHLIPMAVPLGGPRMDPGLTTPMSLTQAPDSVTFDPSKQTPQVTAAKNVAMVTIPTEEEEEKHSPELGKQVTQKFCKHVFCFFSQVRWQRKTLLTIDKLE